MSGSQNKNESADAAFGPPDWVKWGGMGFLDLWALVALSLDMDPDLIKDKIYWGAARLGDDPFRGIRNDDFQRRLANAVSNLGARLPYKPIGDLAQAFVVPVPAFVEFAQSRGWSIPPQVAGDVQASAEPPRALAVEAGPTLSTDDVCTAFAGVGMSYASWATTLKKNCPDWLMSCRASMGRRGAKPVQARWFPLKIASALVLGESRKAGAVPVGELSRAFRKPILQPFATAWADLKADNPAWGD